MAEAVLRFHPSLELFLSPSLRDRPFAARFRPGDTLKNVIEARGVPHTEVGSVTVNGTEVTLSHRLEPGDRVVVFPSAPRAAAGEVRFLLDVHLGRLARDLRALGFDSAWSPPFDDGSLAARSGTEGRVLLTRDRALLMRKAVVEGYLVRSRDAEEQLREVLARFALEGRASPFSRCLSCNGTLVAVEPDEVRAEVPDLVFRLYDAFRRCASCRKIYWKGTHWQAMVRRFGPLLGPR